MWSLRAVVTMTILTGAVLSIPPGLAESDPPHPSPEHNIFWSHTDDGTWMDTDPGHSQGAPGSTAPTGSVDWVLPLDPGLEHALILDPDEPIRIVAYIGGSTHAGTATVSTTLHHGDELLAEGEGQDIVFGPSSAGDGTYESLEWELTPAFFRLEPGKELVWTVEADPVASAIFMGMGDTRGHSHIELPILHVDSDEPEHRFSTHADETFTLQGNESEAVTVLHQANWTVGPANATLELETDIKNGSIQLEVRDAGNETIANMTQNETGLQSMNVTVEQATAGNWTLTLRLTDFVGEYELRALPTPDTSLDQEGTAADENGTTDGSPGNETDPMDDEEGFLPGPGGVTIAILLGLTVHALRRTKRS